MSTKINIALVDDHAITRRGIKALLKQEDDIQIVLEASNGQELLEKLRYNDLDLVLLDISMPVMDGYETLRHLKESFPEIKVIILSTHEEQDPILRMLELDANGYVTKVADPKELCLNIYKVMEDGYYFNEHITRLMQQVLTKKTTKEGTIKTPITDRERQVLELICKGHTAAEIGGMLAISARTVEVHRKKLFSKAGVNKSIGLIWYAIQNRLIDPDSIDFNSGR